MKDVLLAVTERKKSLLKEAPEDLRKHIFKQSRSGTEEFLKKKWNIWRNTELGRNYEAKEERESGGS